MWRQNRVKILITSLVTLLPCLVGLILWPRLPELMPIHFNFSGVADGWESRQFAIFALPCFFLVCHLICMFAMLHDPRGVQLGGKVVAIFMWFMPVTSLIVGICMYANAMNIKINISVIFICFIGLINIVLGNILPKVKPNSSVGIRTVWTVADSENWYHTHRLGGWILVITGVALLTASLWITPWLMLVLVIIAMLVPIVYSFVYYKRHGAGG